MGLYNDSDYNYAQLLQIWQIPLCPSGVDVGVTTL